MCWKGPWRSASWASGSFDGWDAELGLATVHTAHREPGSQTSWLCSSSLILTPSLFFPSLPSRLPPNVPGFPWGFTFHPKPLFEVSESSWTFHWKEWNAQCTHVPVASLEPRQKTFQDCPPALGTAGSCGGERRAWIVSAFAAVLFKNWDFIGEAASGILGSLNNALTRETRNDV